jgi:hypothetical protein
MTTKVDSKETPDLNALVQKACESGLQVEGGIEALFEALRQRVFGLMNPMDLEEGNALMETLISRILAYDDESKNSHKMEDEMREILCALGSNADELKHGEVHGNWLYVDVDYRNGNLVILTGEPHYGGIGLMPETMWILTENEVARLQDVLQRYKGRFSPDCNELEGVLTNALLDLGQWLSRKKSAPRSLQGQIDEAPFYSDMGAPLILTDEQYEDRDLIYRYFEKLLLGEWYDE